VETESCARLSGAGVRDHVAGVKRHNAT